MSHPLEDPELLQGVIRALSDELAGARALAAAAAQLLVDGHADEPERARQRRLTARGAVLVVARGVEPRALEESRLQLLERLGAGDVAVPEGLLGALLLEAGESEPRLPLARPARAQAPD